MTGNAITAPPGTTELAWQRVANVLSFPERNSDGSYTLGYPFPATVKIIYNGAVAA